MTYLIAAVLLILIVGLVILFLSSKKKQQKKAEETAGIYQEEIGEDTVVAPVSEVEGDEGEPDETIEEPTAGQPVYETVEEVVEEEPEQVAAPEEQEEFVELTLASAETLTEAEGQGEEDFAEISLDMKEESVEPQEEIDKVAEEGGEDVDIAPALADSAEEIEATVEAAPEELTEKLNYYFGEDEEASFPVAEAAEEIEEVADEEEIVLDEPVVEPEMPEGELEVEIREPEVPDLLTQDSYADGLHTLEMQLRQELRDVIERKITEQRAVLEYKLQVVCEKQASIEDNFNRQQQLIETAEKVLDAVQQESLRSDLPGFAIEEATKQLRLGNYEQVESMLGEASLQLDHQSELASRVYYLCGQLAEERLDYESAFEDYRNAAAAENDNEQYLLGAGHIARILKNDKDAQIWLEKIVRQGIENGEQTLIQSEAQHELALVCSRSGQKEKAGALFNRALEIQQNILGKDHPDLGPLLHDYAVLFESNGMYEQAEALYTNALTVMEKRFGSNHPKLGSTLNRLAGLYEEMELDERSLPLYERALAIKEEVLGKNHHDVSIILNSLADLLRRQGKLEQAEPMFKRSLEIAENELGKDHPNLTVVLNNLAELYSQMGREEEAARYQERAFSLFELPGMDGDFVEMKKDDVEIDDDKNTTIAGK